jgi:pimeloyl-ACP methyl ester carboxylesterase
MLLVLFAAIAADTGRAYHVPLAAAAESLHVTEVGAGRPVVLIPGMFGSAYTFRRVLPLLAERGFRAIVIEPLGIGFSTTPERANYSLTAQADRIAAVMRQVDAAGAVIVAHSVATSMALRLAYRHPGLASAVVSLEGGVAEAAATAGLRRAARFVPWVKWAGGIKRIRRTMRSGLIEASGDTSWVTDEVVNGYTAGAARDIDGALKAFLAVAVAREPEKLGPHLGEVTIPIHLLRGSAPHKGGPPDDEIRAMQRFLTGLTMESVAGAGLYLQEERPDVVLAAIEAMAAASPAPCGTCPP